ncbi:hypothetical protein TUBRATIS_15350 [Tubulinosema ratisbonensis]|uniref:Uncharacterized protein n=1 Tax=Tubulinosema ratisbonensis TaxID=291195 RepID=A0A437ALH9_9MICR|nr:hypothetical protein TUBRATIS_15350 [Tubulinosema ratisbonensis]
MAKRMKEISLEEQIIILKKQIKEKNAQLNIAQKTRSLLQKEYNQLIHDSTFHPSQNKEKEDERNLKYLNHLLLNSIELTLTVELRNKLNFTSKVLANQMINLIDSIKQKKNSINLYQPKEKNIEEITQLINSYNNLLSLVTDHSFKNTSVSDLFVPENHDLKKYFMALKLVINQVFYKFYTKNDYKEDFYAVSECICKIEECVKDREFDLKECFNKMIVYDYI